MLRADAVPSLPLNLSIVIIHATTRVAHNLAHLNRGDSIKDLCVYIVAVNACNHVIPFGALCLSYVPSFSLRVLFLIRRTSALHWRRKSILEFYAFYSGYGEAGLGVLCPC
jgi:hypothetical protein